MDPASPGPRPGYAAVALAIGLQETRPTVGAGSVPVIAVEHLHKAYGSTVAVDDVSFSVGAGEIFGILGRNGAGKTTTVECLLGLRVPDGGHLSVLGLNPQETAISCTSGSEPSSSRAPCHPRSRWAKP